MLRDIIRIDHETGAERTLDPQERKRAAEIMADHYSSLREVFRQLAEGRTVRCMFASYRYAGHL